jgi:hypothetical protein
MNSALNQHIQSPLTKGNMQSESRPQTTGRDSDIQYLHQQLKQTALEYKPKQHTKENHNRGHSKSIGLREPFGSGSAKNFAYASPVQFLGLSVIRKTKVK